MKAVLLLSILVGFGGTLAGAHYVPWLAHVRLPSHTSVVANGGRSEQFLIHLPADRLAATGFGEYHPVAEGETPDALAQNRRIELKLTER